MPVNDPALKRIAQQAKYRHKNHCRNCNKNFSINLDKCPRCGSKNFRAVHHDVHSGHKSSGARSGVGKI